MQTKPLSLIGAMRLLMNNQVCVATITLTSTMVLGGPAIAAWLGSPVDVSAPSPLASIPFQVALQIEDFSLAPKLKPALLTAVDNIEKAGFNSEEIHVSAVVLTSQGLLLSSASVRGDVPVYGGSLTKILIASEYIQQVGLSDEGLYLVRQSLRDSKNAANNTMLAEIAPTCKARGEIFSEFTDLSIGRKFYPYELDDGSYRMVEDMEDCDLSLPRNSITTDIAAQLLIDLLTDQEEFIPQALDSTLSAMIQRNPAATENALEYSQTAGFLSEWVDVEVLSKAALTSDMRGDVAAIPLPYGRTLVVAAVMSGKQFSESQQVLPQLTADLLESLK
jgi:hypothetical protein